MRKRILSLVLAIAMCFSMVSVVVNANTDDDMILMETEFRNLINNYRDRVWNWQANQFDGMTDEQTETIDAIWAGYNEDAVKPIATELATAIVGAGDMLSHDTMKDLYKWKLMRDIMEGRLDVTSDDANYQDWLARFTAFETENDEAISASQPGLALNGLGDYSADLTVYFGELAEMVVVDGVVLEGEDAAEANAYLAAYDYVTATDDMSGIQTYLEEDVIEMMAEGMVNAFTLGMQVATNQINEENTDGLFGKISDRDMKSAFLLAGEDFVRYMINTVVPEMKDDLLQMNKTDLIAEVVGDATAIPGGNNEATVDALYATMKNVAHYVLAQDFSDGLVDRVADEYGIDLRAEENNIVDTTVDKLKAAMTAVDEKHGLELVHLNRYIGREILRYENGEELPYINGAEIDGDTATEVVLKFAHNRYPAIASLNNYRLATFDANCDANGIKVYAHEETVGTLVLEVTEEANGTETVNIYRGYTDEDLDGVVENEEDVYRYVASFTVTATSDVVVEEPYVTLDDVLDTTVDGTIEVKGTTNLDHVTVAIIKNGETIYAVVYEKAEFEAGITLNAPDAAEEGDVYTVVVGTEKASASDEFAIEGAAVTYEVVLDDVADTTADGTIEVKGTTNLDYVTVAIVKGGETIYAVVYTKAEFEAGITLNAPDAAEEGDVYTVVVGTEKASDSDEFAIVEDTPIVYEITLDDIADFKLSDNENAEIVVKGTTNLEHVVVTVTLGSDNVYAVTHTKAEFEAGITIAIDGAAVGNVYTVAVGTEAAEAEDTFEILPEDVVAPTLALAGKTTRSVTKGRTIDITTTPQNVPAGSTAEVVWTTEDGEVVEVTATSGDSNNIATVKGLKKGETTLTATLYVDGVATDATVTVTVKVTTGGTSSKDPVVNITVKVDETKNVVKVPTGGTKVEFTGTGDGEVKVEIVDGVVVVTGVKEGEVKGTVKVTNDSGRTVLTGDYKFTVTEGDVVTPDHKCEWPDIAATATKDAHWAHETIDIMTINGYIKGYEDGTFKPDQNITRAEFSAIVYRILGLEVAEDGVLYDDTTGHWAEDIIATMSLPEGYGMLRGYGDGNFGPNDLITREQAVAIIARAKSAVWVEAEEGAKDVFTDAEDISWWFDGEMDAAVTNGLITGYEDGSYKPKSYTTRAEACVLLARAWPEVLE
ncbi:MAG: S-layer homology domain-containing protein [Clostridia bacterium]|nr:S-layer homology domain-containing protein [Clostridia bacterium]